VFIMPRPICIYVHKITLQFYVCFTHLFLLWSVIFFPASPLVHVVQSYHMRVGLRYLQLIGGLLVIFLLGVCYC
jgi:hypothetical protein